MLSLPWLSISHGTSSANTSVANATWYMAWSCGPTLTSCQRPSVTEKRSPIHCRSRSASPRVVAGS